MKPQRLAVIIALLALLALGIAFGPYALPQAAFLQKFKPKFGLDIQGGARVVLEADTTKLPKGQEWTQDTKSAIVNILSQRVNANGVSEAVITPKGDKQFVVELPAVKNEQQILDQLQNTAQLQFFYSPDWKTNRNSLGRYVFEQSETPDHKEYFQIRDTASQKTFRDRFHINQALSELLSKAPDAPAAGLTETTLPENLAALTAAQGKKTAFLTADQQKSLAGLSDELTAFDAFLAQAQLEMDGSDLKPTARGTFDPATNTKAMVELEFNAAGKEKFGNFTKDHTNEILMIYLDGQILMAPNIETPILDGRAQISPFPSIRDAKELADYLNGGALPVPLKIVQQQSVEATIGNEAVHQGLLAGLIGLGLVVVFMILYYLLPGSIACAALILYTLFTYAAFLLAGVTFTLPGIAGFILSVGMAVDANILIFERTKEELRDGRTLRSAIEHGFQRAFSAIFDSNLCTAVTSLFLYNFGTGPVRGFALTLLIGVVISMFTAITVTRTFLLLLLGGRENNAHNLAAWGLNRAWTPHLDVVRRRGLFYLISLAVIVPGLIFAFKGGFKPGIDFTGGTEVRLQFPATTPVTRESVEEAVRAQGYEDPAAQLAGDNTVYLRLPRQKAGDVTQPQTDDLVKALQAKFPGVEKAEYSLIGSSISAELTRNALTSVLFSSIFIVLYLAFRFAIGGFVNGLKFGIAAIVAMLHDVLVLVGVFAILGYFLNWKVDSLFVTAALTVIGFSVHDTIVIFDRIRENLKGRGGRDDFDHIVSRSINETFSRSINTSLTVVLTLVALLIFAGPVIRPLNAALLIGIVSGTYSSIFNAAPLVVDFTRWLRKRGVSEGGIALAPAGAGTKGDAPSRVRASGAGNAAARPVPPVGPTTPSPQPGTRPIPPLTPSPRSAADRGAAYRPNGTNGTSGGGSAAETEKPPLPQGPKPRKRRM